MFCRRPAAIAAAAILSLFISGAARCQVSLKDDDPIQMELEAMGKRGSVIAHAREGILTILESENACSVWFQEVSTDPAEVFRSLHYEIKKSGPAYVLRRVDIQRGKVLKHPWGARSTQYGGRDSTIALNPNGPFFSSISPVMDVDPGGIPVRPVGFQKMRVASFRGDTDEAQITTLLHELGHILGRLPEDSDSWDGRSSRNTSEVLQHCRHEIRIAAKRPSRSNN